MALFCKKSVCRETRPLKAPSSEKKKKQCNLFYHVWNKELISICFHKSYGLVTTCGSISLINLSAFGWKSESMIWSQLGSLYLPIVTIPFPIKYNFWSWFRAEKSPSCNVLIWLYDKSTSTESGGIVASDTDCKFAPDCLNSWAEISLTVWLDIKNIGNSEKCFSNIKRAKIILNSILVSFSSNL